MDTLIYFAVPIAMVLVAGVIYRRVSPGGTSVATEASGGATATVKSEPGVGTMRPVVDVGTCMGSGGCVRACPHDALGMVRGRAVLANPNHCLGHGVCAAACPVGAISFIAGLPQANAAGG